jgi:outer membrane protein TolC
MAKWVPMLRVGVAGLGLAIAFWPPAVWGGTGQQRGSALKLTLADAITRGLAQNTTALLAEQDVRAARGARLVALSGVLPSLTASAGVAREKISLDEYGFPVAPGESPLLGPFDVVKAQLGFSQALLDVGAIARARAGGHRLEAARLSLEDTRALVVAACAGLYLQAVAEESRVDATRAQLVTAEALAGLAHDMKRAGTVPGIDVLRADVQLAAQRQRMIRAENERDRRRLTLAKAIGLSQSELFELVDRVPYSELATLPLEEALTKALAVRPDLRSATASLSAAASDLHAAIGLTLPSVHVDASVAAVGPSASTTHRTYALAGAVRVPLFEGGRAQGQIAQNRARLEQQRVRVADLRARVELEVRTSLLDLDAATRQVDVAGGAQALATQQLAQAQDRFAAGVASNIEVVQAQQALAEASENYIASLLAHNLAKLSLARALGVAGAQVSRYLGGENEHIDRPADQQ